MTRAERRARTEAVRARRHHLRRAVDPLAAPCSPSTIGKMRSRSALGCGHPRCGLCHPGKRWKAKSDRVKRRVEARSLAKTAVD